MSDTPRAGEKEPVRPPAGDVSSVGLVSSAAISSAAAAAVATNGTAAVAASHHGTAALSDAMAGEEMVSSEREEGKRDIGSVTEESVTEAKRMRSTLDSTALEDGGGVQKLPSMADLNEAASLIAEEAVEEREKAAGEGTGEGLQGGRIAGPVAGGGAEKGEVEVANGCQSRGYESRDQGKDASSLDAPAITGMNGLLDAKEGMVGEGGEEVATCGVERLLEPSLVMMDVSEELHQEESFNPFSSLSPEARVHTRSTPKEWRPPKEPSCLMLDFQIWIVTICHLILLRIVYTAPTINHPMSDTNLSILTIKPSPHLTLNPKRELSKAPVNKRRE